MNEIQFKKDNLFHTFATYASANVLSMMGLSFNVLTDTFFVANGIGSTALAALNIVLPIFALIAGLGLMNGMGSATKYMIFKASKNHEEGNKVFTHGLYYAGFLSVILFILGVFFSEDIVVLLGANKETLSLARDYCATILGFAFAFLFNHHLICMIRNDGAPKLAMIAMLSGNITNIIFDYLFIYEFNMGLFGAAIATCFSPVVSMIILSSYLFKKKNHFHLIKCKLEMATFLAITKIGSSSFLNEMSSGLVMLAFNYSILAYAGNIGIAAYGIIANLGLVFQAVFTGLAQGIQPLLSYAFGVKDQASIHKLIKYALITSLLIGVCFYLSGLCFPNQLVALFNQKGNEALSLIATNGITLYFPAFIFMGINIVLTCFFASVNAPSPSLLLSLLRGFVLVLMFIYVLPSFLQLDGIWLSVPASECISCMIGLGILFFYIKKENKLI
ncbi:MAG: MATE family efflux transporter [Erysipelotrichaceae bacterium]